MSSFSLSTLRNTFLTMFLGSGGGSNSSSGGAGVYAASMFGSSSSSHEATMTIKDYTNQASGFFSLIRLPAATIAGSSLTAMFTKCKASQHYNKREQQLFRAFHVLAIISYSLSITTVILSHSATVTLLQYEFNGHYPSPYLVLINEFKYEYTICRWSFITSIMTFVTAITLRIILEFQLLATTTTTTTTKQSRRSQSKQLHLYIIIGMMSTLLLNFLSYINRTAYTWNNYFEMTLAVLQLLIQQSITTTTKDGVGSFQIYPLHLLSVLTLIFTIVCCLQYVFVTTTTTTNEEEEGNDENLLPNETKTKTNPQDSGISSSFVDATKTTNGHVQDLPPPLINDKKHI